MARKDTASTRSLDRAETLELLGLHRNLLAEADLAGSATNERDAVRVQRLVDGSRTGLGARDRDAALVLLHLLGECLVVAGTEALDDRRLHGELDEVKREEPNDILYNRVSI